MVSEMKNIFIRNYSTSFICALIFVLCTFLISCGQESEEKTAEAVLSARNFLTKKNCEKALSAILEDAGSDTDAAYLTTLASAYACKGGYSTTKFFTDDISLFSSVNNSVLGGLTKFSTSSSMDAPDNEEYENLQLAIDTLLYSGGLSASKNPTSVKRTEKLDVDDAGNIDAFLMYLIMAQLGKYLYFYGDSSSTGLKGSGAGSNGCLFPYDGSINIKTNFPAPLDNATLGAILASPIPDTGSCTTAADGHPDMTSLSSTVETKRLCQGVVLMNNFLDIFPKVLSRISYDDLDVLNNVEGLINTAKNNIYVSVAGDMDSTFAITSQEKCEADYAVDNTKLQVYFVALFETQFI